MSFNVPMHHLQSTPRGIFTMFMTGPYPVIWQILPSFGVCFAVTSKMLSLARCRAESGEQWMPWRF